ncbi:RecBCD enzyme subunit RecB [Candidatus Methylobacter favarea]|uniref:RecBCD enzyme subunit RecB n=1 Tax=Candidatus Methylobacter favarea TaxID=2707345 RepID=A0A8S0WN56_9GAMM|nr:exodeoxyribonuclease V subunit beta [Candidatus Methylobacter favarea]CAA9890182.1 RecBCD enzyme subunit RecB [Candidatus Methylobacter favarea]
MPSNYFDPLQTELLKGINLLEASAGTGKTHTIAMLVLRFVVEQDLAIDKLLIVTFTKAAMEELKERVRSKLTEAGMALQGHTARVDSAIIDWLAHLDIDTQLVRHRLKSALLTIDQAGIFTIHGFCQRVLREHALESGQLFDMELTGDLSLVKQACADDFWRQQVYNRPLREAAVLTADYKTPGDLLASIDCIGAPVSVYPDCKSLDEELKQLQQLTELAKNALDDCAGALLAGFADQKFKPGYSRSFDLHYCSLRNWLHGHSALPPCAEALALLTLNGLMEALHGSKFKADKTRTCEQRKADYLAELALTTEPFDSLAKALKHITVVFRRTLLETLRKDLNSRLLQQNALSFDHLISRLAEALQGKKGALLTTELQQRFRVALIDEFQDTDESQWFIFSTLFAAPSHYLYLIGDPKQAIYKFRGADIYSYLAAQKQAQHHFTLGKNWRSQPQLVDAVNSLFQREQAFLLKDLAFKAVKPALTADNGVLQSAGQAIAPLMLWQLPESRSKTGYWTAGKAAEAIRAAVINEIVNLLSKAYAIEPGNRALQPEDIAILVRTNTQAREYQQLLRAAGVPSVLNSTESVFASQEAADLYFLLQAVANPADSILLKQALALNWFGLDGQALCQIINNDTALDVWMSRFLSYYQEWRQTGLMAMMQRLLAQEKVRLHLSKTLAAERQLTNLHHLIELLQQAVVDERLGINKTLNWLRIAISRAHQDKSSAEDQQLRLESDQNAVKIVTMHRSKGLEYAIVFCPCLWQRNSHSSSEKLWVTCHKNGRMIMDIGSDDFEEHRALAVKEELAEDLRLAYVAVTRAKYRCYIAWADVRYEKAANESAMAWLLDFAEADFSRQQTLLQAFRDKAAQAFNYQLLEAPGVINRLYQMPAASADFCARRRKRYLFTSWQMSSYTALSALSLPDAPEIPVDKAGEQQQDEIDQPASAVITGKREIEPRWEQLPRGSHTGNVVHELLENCAFADLSERMDISKQRDKACRRYGLKLEQPAVIDELLQAVVSTPLSETDHAFCLKNLPERTCLKEMPFYLSMQTMDTSQINRILQNTPVFQPLTGKQMCGYLTGFIDLICEYNGRYYVMDYKTNGLTGYSRESLLHAMREHNYGLQFWLYTVVLHRYLQMRLPRYDYERHFGGVRYLFVRGMQPETAMRGVYQDRPALEKIEAMAALFGDRNAS